MSARSALAGKILLAPFGAIWVNFLCGPEKNEKTNATIIYFPWWANGPYSPGLGPQWNLHYLNTDCHVMLSRAMPGLARFMPMFSLSIRLHAVSGRNPCVGVSVTCPGHWPTKENRQYFDFFLYGGGSPWKNWPQMAQMGPSRLFSF